MITKYNCITIIIDGTYRFSILELIDCLISWNLVKSGYVIRGDVISCSPVWCLIIITCCFPPEVHSCPWLLCCCQVCRLPDTCPWEVARWGSIVQTANRAELYSSWQPEVVTSCLFFLLILPLFSFFFSTVLLFFLSSRMSSPPPPLIIDELSVAFDFYSHPSPPFPLFLPALSSSCHLFLAPRVVGRIGAWRHGSVSGSQERKVQAGVCMFGSPSCHTTFTSTRQSSESH